MDHFQWIVALTRIISAVFRKGGDISFLVEELRSVFDPAGGYFKKRRQIHALAGGRDWGRHSLPPGNDRHAQKSRLRMRTNRN